MKFFALFAVLLCCNVAGSQAQTPEQEQIAKLQAEVTALQAEVQALKKPCDCDKGAIFDQDTEDVGHAVLAGFGKRPAIGPHRKVTLAMRQYLADIKAGRADATERFNAAAIQPARAINPQRACRIATFAVIGLQLASAFGVTIPPEVIAAAKAIQQQICAIPVPVPQANAPAAPAPHKAHATGLVLPPEAVRNQAHVRDALRNRVFHSKHGTVPLPASYDLRTLGLVTPIKDQGSCGSCHDFSGVDVIESSNIIVGNLVNTIEGWISEQWCIDTNINHDGGCNGGDANTIFTYCQQGGGVPLTSVYGPYAARSHGASQLSTTATGYTLSDWGYASTVTNVADVVSVKEAILQFGAISVAVGADGPFESYSGGIYTRDVSRGINHQVALVGWQDDASVPGGGYWILRNSWSTAWGEGGYMKIAYTGKPTTEAMYGKATKGMTTVVPSGTGPKPPKPPRPTPTRRAAILSEKATRMFSTGKKADQDRVLKALEAAENVLQNAQ